MSRLLLVEDDVTLRSQLADIAAENGFDVIEAGDGKAAAPLPHLDVIDIAVVDLGLPLMSGLELITLWRQENFDFPILILTARDSWQDKVVGLETGADDYLSKPFHVGEFVARVNALCRRSQGLTKQIVQAGPIALDLQAKTVKLDGQAINLTAYEFEALKLLMTQSGKVISKQALAEHIYGHDAEKDSNVIEVFVGRLRKKIDPSGLLQPIKTQRGQGYRFEVDA